MQRFVLEDPVQGVEDRFDMIIASCIAKQPLTFHEVYSCIPSWMKLQYLCLEYKCLKRSTSISSCSGGGFPQIAWH